MEKNYGYNYKIVSKFNKSNIEYSFTLYTNMETLNDILTFRNEEVFLY